MKNIHGIQIEDSFYNCISSELIPTSTTKIDFWLQFAALVQAAQWKAARPKATHSPEVSLRHPRYALKAINARWGSLYAALYHANGHTNAIPHSPGLKTGQRYNVARASRVIAHAREFLDSAFPLSEGSHKDAVSYLVYFQHVMVTLADGSIVGLKNPAHFVAKSGHKEAPQAIVLKNSDVHVEIRFNRNGTVGSGDIAGIDDIMVEAPARTVLSIDADTPANKCNVLRNLTALIDGTLKVSFYQDGKQRTRRLNRDVEFTARDSDSYLVARRNPVALQLHADTECPAVCDAKGNAMPAAVVDAALIGLLSRIWSASDIALMASSPTAFEMIKPVVDHLHQTSEVISNVEVLKSYQDSFKDPEASADIARHLQCVRIEEKELRNSATIAKHNTAVLDAIQQSYLPH